MILRPYQNEAVDSVFNFLFAGPGNPLIAMPTGTGKSAVIAGICQRALRDWPETRILMLTHVKELLKQNEKALKRVWPEAPVGIYSAGLKRRQVDSITMAGVASVYRKPEILGTKHLIIIDEAHLLGPDDETMYQSLLRKLKEVNPNLRVIGLTATPFRLKQGMLTDGGLFTDICFDQTGIEKFNELIEAGYLAPLIARSTKLQIDTSEVSIRGGEFAADEIEKLVDADAITQLALDEAQRLGEGRKRWIAFCSSVNHAEHVAEALRDRGLKAKAVHSKMPGEERDLAIAQFVSGEIDAVTNFGVLTTGFDCPDIDLMLLLRPTRSPGLHVQILGRGTRPSPGKTDCLVLDFAMNVKRLGPINNPQIPTKHKRGTESMGPPMKTCPECDALYPIGARVCPCCGYESPAPAGFVPKAGTDDIIAKTRITRETFPVDFIQYNIHHKAGKPPSLRVQYASGLSFFNEWVCPEHSGYARTKFEQWWARRGSHLVLKTIAGEKYPTIEKFIFVEEEKLIDSV